MVFGILRGWRRSKLLKKPFPRVWDAILKKLPFFERLTPQRRKTLRRIVRILAHEKYWEGCGGLKITPNIVISIAGQAALPILNIRHDYYRAIDSILIYPDTFVNPTKEERMPMAGEAHYQGPVILSWAAVKKDIRRPDAGRNVAIHEFVHKLDALDGYFDGVPPLASRKQFDVWVAITRRERKRLEQAANAGEKTVLDPYGASDPAEFFAVASECFFTTPRKLHAKHPGLYRLLKGYFRQDPSKAA